MKKKIIFIAALIVVIIIIVLIFLYQNGIGSSLYFYYDQNRNSMYDVIYPIYTITASGEAKIENYDITSVIQLDDNQIKELEEDLKELEEVLEEKNANAPTKNSYIVINKNSFEYVDNDSKSIINEIIQEYFSEN